MFNEATQINYKISYDEFYTERRGLSDLITQADIGCSQQGDNPKYFFGAHQTRARADTADKNHTIAIFDNLNLQKYYVEIDGVRYQRDSVLLKYEQYDFIEQYKDLKLYFKDYIDEELLTPFISYPDMKTKYSIELLDLRHQSDHITPKKIQLFHEYSADPEIARFFTTLVRRREREMISDGNKLIEVKFIQLYI